MQAKALQDESKSLPQRPQPTSETLKYGGAAKQNCMFP